MNFGAFEFGLNFYWALFILTVIWLRFITQIGVKEGVKVLAGLSVDILVRFSPLRRSTRLHASLTLWSIEFKRVNCFINGLCEFQTFKLRSLETAWSGVANWYGVELEI